MREESGERRDEREGEVVNEEKGPMLHAQPGRFRGDCSSVSLHRKKSFGGGGSRILFPPLCEFLPAIYPLFFSSFFQFLFSEFLPFPPFLLSCF